MQIIRQNRKKDMKIAIPEYGTPQPNYRAALATLGAEPVQVGADADAQEFDGLLLPGGVDINPSRYGCANLGSVGIDDELDALQFSVLDQFVRAGKPVLGICRGHQLISVYFGLQLIQHLPSSEIHATDPLTGKGRSHLTRSVPRTLIDRLYGPSFRTNSSHHQAAMADGCGLKTMAISEDGVIEALYHESLPIFSVQWHPEKMCFALADSSLSDGSIILSHFLSLCREKSGA